MRTSIGLFFIGILLFQSCDQNSNHADAYGNFEADILRVAAETQGKILSLTLEEGLFLEQGETVGWIDTSLLHVQKQQILAQQNVIQSKKKNIRAQITVQEEQLANVQREQKRIQKLYDDGVATEKQKDDIDGQVAVSQKQLIATKTQLQALRAELEVSAKQLALVEEQMKKCKIVNPVSGRVLEEYLKENELAAPAKTLYKIAGMDKLYLRVYLSGSQLSDLHLNQKVRVFIDHGPDDFYEYAGKVVWISSQAEFTPKIIQTKEERVNLVYAAKIEVKNDGKLKIGMPGEIRFLNK